MRTHPIRILCLALGLAAAALSASAKTGLSITGLGWFGNINMERRIAFLSGGEDSEEDLDLMQIEDIAFIILQQVIRDGYTNPVLDGTITFAGDQQVSLTWSIPFKGQLPDPLPPGPVTSVHFTCRPGILSFYQSVEVEGVDAIAAKTLRGYFMPSGVLFTRKSDLAYTPGNFESRLARLLRSLQEQGYLQARVTGRSVTQDPASGAVDVRLHIDQGRLHQVGSVRTERVDEGGHVESAMTEAHAGETFSTVWLRNRRQEFFNELYAAGYPDTRIAEEQLPGDAGAAGVVPVDVVFRIERGPRISLSGVRFEPAGLVNEAVLRRTVDLEESEVYDLLKVETGRRRLLSLGVFNDVDLEQEAVTPDSRAVLYTLSPLPRQSLRLLAGWGSYEQLRAGLRWEQRNLWKRAHRYTFDLLASSKSYGANLSYVVPHFIDDRTTAYATMAHEFREEISHDRTTTTVLMGASRRLRWSGTEFSLEYSLEQQEAEGTPVRTLASSDDVTVSSLTGRFVIDRRDSALYPTRGYDASLTSKTASEALGSEADFEKVELATSYHAYLGAALYLHLALRYGAAFSEVPTADNLPFTERFFLGGENTIRGYTQGEASPRSVDGDAIGAETYALVNVELEQRILAAFSLVLFWDSLVQSEDIQATDDPEFLNSAGIGLRLRTPVGPIRLEYGHNINPRPSDPNGTFHLSVGYPF